MNMSTERDLGVAVIVEKTCLKIKQHYPHFNTISTNWNFWSDLHYVAGYGTCVMIPDPSGELGFYIPNLTRDQKGRPKANIDATWTFTCLFEVLHARAS